MADNPAGHRICPFGLDPNLRCATPLSGSVDKAAFGFVPAKIYLRIVGVLFKKRISNRTRD